MRKEASTVLNALILGLLMISGCNAGSPKADQTLKFKVDSLQLVLDKLLNRLHIEASHLSRIDSMNLEAFAKGNFQAYHKMHRKSVIVTWPDGSKTAGLEDHHEVMKNSFQFAPDIKVVKHTMSFGSGDWTCTLGTLSGTFTKPLVLQNRTIVPNGKQFTLPVCTVTHWIDNQVADEYLYWDNKTLLEQIGVL